jgi:hypothetical protein
MSAESCPPICYGRHFVFQMAEVAMPSASASEFPLDKHPDPLEPEGNQQVRHERERAMCDLLQP